MPCGILQGHSVANVQEDESRGKENIHTRLCVVEFQMQLNYAVIQNSYSKIAL